MTETDWLTGTDFAAMAQFAAERLSPRRQRLLAAAFCRAVGHLLDHPTLTEALAVIEQYADGSAAPADVEKARQRCRDLVSVSYEAYRTAVDGGTTDEGLRSYVRSELAWAVSYATNNPLQMTEVGTRAATATAQARTGAILLASVAPSVLDKANAEQGLVMRAVVWEVVGNPFRAVDFAPWRTDTAVSLARQMYESREFSAMPILADALQDAGCDNEDVLNHCREAGEHVRGCWVVDGVLGKE